MGRIIFVNPFAKSLITGGIKATYSHAALLTELGFSAAVFQPDGAPSWCSPELQALVTDKLEASADDILVFPEVLNGWLAEAARTPTPARKVMFCQNQYYMLSYRIDANGYRQLGFSHFIVPGEITKRALVSILKLPEVSVVPNFVDRELFHPREKAIQITTVPRKWAAHAGYPGHADLLQIILAQKYPSLRGVPWLPLENKSEHEVAEIMGRSAIFLALCYMEACPLAPLEAMAAGCLIVGYHGYGGLEYASRENGIWMSPEYLEQVADALAAAITGLQRGDAGLAGIRDAGMATAARFNRQRTKTAVEQVYGALLRR
jgi:glycosyltransferase involved in cell wall biosynthesis